MNKHNAKKISDILIKAPWPAISRYLYLRNNAKKVTDNAGLYHYAGNNPIRYIDPDGNYIILNQNQEKRTNDFVAKQKIDSIYLVYGNQKMASFGYCFNDMKGAFPLIASSNALQGIDSPKITISTPFGNEINKSQSEYSMNGTLNDGFNAVDDYKKNKDGSVPIVHANIKQTKNGFYAIEVTIEIGREKYNGIVAYAGAPEIMTSNKQDQLKINKIANDSINFLRGTVNEIQNITE